MSDSRDSKSFRVFRAAPDGAAEVVEGHGESSNAPLADMALSTHVLSLNAIALMHLGVVEDPDGQVARSREAARQIIDTLTMLRVKTKGNLTADESRLLDTVLYDLRMHYVRK